MDILQLQLFSSIARTLNFSRTAEQFFLTQPTVSHHMKKLEEALGVKLINRSSHDVSLTAEGREFLTYATQIITISSTAENRIQNMAQGRWGHLRIAALSSTTFQLSDCMVKLYGEYPLIQVDIDLLEGTEMINALRQGNHDCYFASAPMIPADNEYESTTILIDALGLYVNTCVADSIDLSDWTTVERQPFVSVPRSDTTLTSRIQRVCMNRGIKPYIINYYNRAESVVLSVNCGIGVAILPGALGLLYQHSNVTTFQIDGDDAKMTFVFAWKKGNDNSVFRLFRDTVLSIYDKPEAFVAK